MSGHNHAIPGGVLAVYGRGTGTPSLPLRVHRPSPAPEYARLPGYYRGMPACSPLPGLWVPSGLGAGVSYGVSGYLRSTTESTLYIQFLKNRSGYPAIGGRSRKC